MYNLTFQLGANVYGRNKHCGYFTKIVVEPHSWQLTDLIVEEGLLVKRALVLPIAQIKETRGQTILLNVSSEQLKELHTYEETTIEKGISDWPATKTVGEVEYGRLPAANIPNLARSREKTRLGVRNEAVILDGNTTIACLDGNLGLLSHIIVDAKDYLISDLVFKQGTLFPKYYIVSTRYLDSLNESQAQIAIDRFEAEQLPQYTFLYER
jgi:uncharacterized protein YrrD